MNSRELRNGFISLGNDSIDQFLGGGLLHSSINLIERKGPSSKMLDAVWLKSLATTTLSKGDNLLILNFNTGVDLTSERYLASLPYSRKVRTDLLYRDIRHKSQTEKIKIAWRYANQNYNSSPSDASMTQNQVDFGIPFMKSLEGVQSGQMRIVNLKADSGTKDVRFLLTTAIDDLKKSSQKPINILIYDILHPFSPLIDNDQEFLKIMYMSRCVARSLGTGCFLFCIDVDMCSHYETIQQMLYNIADSVITFFSYETNQGQLTGYKSMDGTLEYTKVPKINSLGLHFEQQLSDWGYRFTSNHRYFMIDELSLPPCDDNDEIPTKKATELTNTPDETAPLQQVGPLEDFKAVASNVFKKAL